MREGAVHMRKTDLSSVSADWHVPLHWKDLDATLLTPSHIPQRRSEMPPCCYSYHQASLTLEAAESATSLPYFSRGLNFF